MASPASSRSHDSGDAASTSATPSSGARAAAEIVALTSRDEFLLELGEALSGQSSIRPVDSIALALEHLNNPRRIQILAIDARETTDLRGDVERAHAQAPHVTVLVFASADSEKQTAAALKGTNTFAVLPSPIDKRKTAAVFEGAIADATARRASSRSNDQTRVPTPSSSASAASAPITVEAASIGMQRPNIGRAESGGDKRTMMIAGGAVVVLALGAAAWFFTRGGEEGTKTASAAPAVAKTAPAPAQPAAKQAPKEETVAPVSPVVTETALVKGNVDELLEKARLAMRERRYTEPAGDNALLYYRSAAAADASNGEAIDGLGRVASVLSGRFDESMAASQFDEAAVALANMKAAMPADKGLAARELKLASAQISKAMGEGNLDRAAALVRGAQQSGSVPADQIAKWRGEINRRQDEVKQKRLVEQLNESIKEGRLLEPANDNAKHHLEQLREAGASAAVVQRMSRDLGGAYLRKARESSLANKQADADRWIAEAKGAGLSANDINAFQKDVAAARQRAIAAEAERLGQLARERIGQGRLTDPAQDSAAYYLNALQSADSDNPAIATASRELAAKLIERARAAARDGKAAQVEADLAQAKKWGADAKDIQAVQQTASNRAASGGGNLRQASSENLQTRLKRVKYAAPEFPERAMQQRVSGSVTVEFLVSVTGETDDVRVVASEPAGVFDRAAIAAVKRWRYEPVVIDNVPTEVPAKAVIRFALPK